MAWYKDGVQFECQGSGKCCVSHGEYGFVYLNKKDRRRMARFLGLTVKEFIQAHCHITDGFLHLKQRRSCEFLSHKKCTIYEARPTQCRTWPFWPDTLNAKSWNTEVKKFCPGVGKGRTYSAGEIEKLAGQTADSDSFLV